MTSKRKDYSVWKTSADGVSLLAAKVYSRTDQIGALTRPNFESVRLCPWIEEQRRLSYAQVRFSFFDDGDCPRPQQMQMADFSESRIRAEAAGEEGSRRGHGVVEQGA